MRLLIPVLAMVAGAAEVALGTVQADPSTALMQWLTGGLILVIGGWAIRDHFALKAMHEANTRRLERIIDTVEGDEGLIEDRRLTRERRHEQANKIQTLSLRVALLERHAEKVSGYEPPDIEEMPHRRRGEGKP